MSTGDTIYPYRIDISICRSSTSDVIFFRNLSQCRSEKMVSYRKQIARHHAEEFGCCVVPCGQSQWVPGIFVEVPRWDTGRCWPIRNTLLPYTCICYHAEFGRFMSNGMSEVESQNFGEAAWGSALLGWQRDMPLWNTLFFSCVSPPKLIVLGQTEKRTLAFRLSRSLKVIGTVMDRSATYDFLLVINQSIIKF